jgi:hypothetical protein
MEEDTHRSAIAGSWHHVSYFVGGCDAVVAAAVPPRRRQRIMQGFAVGWEVQSVTNFLLYFLFLYCGIAGV